MTKFIAKHHQHSAMGCIMGVPVMTLMVRVFVVVVVGMPNLAAPKRAQCNEKLFN